MNANLGLHGQIGCHYIPRGKKNKKTPGCSLITYHQEAEMDTEIEQRTDIGRVFQVQRHKS